MFGMEKNQSIFDVDPEVTAFISERKGDFRLCTTCGGPVIVPVEMKGPKDSDIVMQMGPNKLYISRVQAHYLRRIEKRMLAYYEGYMEKKDFTS
jgi:hypothetical protein